MKIAIVIEHFNPARGGAETYTAGLVGWLVAGGHDVTIFTQDWVGEREQATLVAVPTRGVSAARRYLSFSTTASELVGQGDFDVVHSMARILRLDVFHPHGGVMRASLERSLAATEGGLQRGLRRAARWLNTKSDVLLELESILYTEDPPPRLVAVSQMVADDMKRYYGIDESQVDVVYNGVDASRFSPETRATIGAGLREELGIGTDALLLLLVAHNYRLKGVEILIRVMAELVKRGGGNFKALVVGSKNPSQTVYPKLAEKLGVGDRVLFHPGVADIKRFYAAADVYFHPTFYDPMSLVVLEALGAGLPVITTRHNGCSEIMTDGQEGFCIDEPRDVDALVERVGLLADDDRRLAMSTAARALALEFPLERNYEGLMAVYLKAADQRRTEVTTRREP